MISCPEHLCYKRRLGVEVADDSMEPTLPQGNPAIFEYHRRAPESRKIVIARVPQFGITGDTAITHRIPGCRGVHRAGEQASNPTMRPGA
jgi:hypothetical protein